MFNRTQDYTSTSPLVNCSIIHSAWTRGMEEHTAPCTGPVDRVSCLRNPSADMVRGNVPRLADSELIKVTTPHSGGARSILASTQPASTPREVRTVQRRLTQYRGLATEEALCRPRTGGHDCMFRPGCTVVPYFLVHLFPESMKVEQCACRSISLCHLSDSRHFEVHHGGRRTGIYHLLSLLSFMLTHRTVPERTGDADICIYVQDSRPRNQDFT